MAAMEKTSTPGVYRKGTRYVVVWRHRGQQHKSSHRTYAEAREAKGRRAAGDRRPASRVTVEEYARQWIDTYRGRTQRGFSETTRVEYRRALDHHVIPHLGRYRLDEVEPQDVRSFFLRLERQGVTAAGVAKVRAPLRAMFADAIEDGTVRHNPARIRIRRTTEPAQVEEKPKAMTRVQLGKLLGALPEEWRPFFEFLAHTGLRISEAIALTWSDVEFGTRPVVHVRTQVYRGERKRLKSEHSRRTLPLSPPAWPGLCGRRSGRRRAAQRVLRCSHPRRGACCHRRTWRGECSSRRRKPPASSGSASTASGTPARRCCSRPGRTRSRCRCGSATTIRASRSRPTSTSWTRDLATPRSSTPQLPAWATAILSPLPKS